MQNLEVECYEKLHLQPRQSCNYGSRFAVVQVVHQLLFSCLKFNFAGGSYVFEEKSER